LPSSIATGVIFGERQIDLVIADAATEEGKDTEGIDRYVESIL